VPFDAISKFYDPSVAFGLMFEDEDFDADEDLDDTAFDDDESSLFVSQASSDQETDEKPVGEVISLDSFRDK
jgi:hypothetical protein